MRVRPGRLIAVAGVIFIGVASSQCSSPKAPAAAPAKGPSAVNTKLIGDMTPVVSVKELMQYMIDPIADNVFDAVWTDITPKGTIEHMPRTDEDWENVRVGATTLAEGIFLLKVPRPFTPPGDVNNSTGENPPELSPTQIQAKLDKDPVVWDAKIQALRNVALEVLDVVKKKDVQGLFEASEDLDQACEQCHLEYWYPGDKDDVERDKLKKVSREKPRAYQPTGTVKATVKPVPPGTKQ